MEPRPNVWPRSPAVQEVYCLSSEELFTTESFSFSGLTVVRDLPGYNENGCLHSPPGWDDAAGTRWALVARRAMHQLGAAAQVHRVSASRARCVSRVVDRAGRFDRARVESRSRSSSSGRSGGAVRYCAPFAEQRVSEHLYSRRTRARLTRAGLSSTSIQKFLSDVVGDDLHVKTIVSIGNATLGVLHAASLCIHVIGRAYGWATRAVSPWLGPLASQ